MIALIHFFADNMQSTEAVTPHGWDNALLQLVPSAMLVIHYGELL